MPKNNDIKKRVEGREQREVGKERKKTKKKKTKGRKDINSMFNDNHTNTQ
jgi:hypothetical protein